MIGVEVNGSIDQALRRLKRRLSREGVLGEIKDRDRGYLKPSERRREKHDRAVRRQMKRDEHRAGEL